VAEADMLKKLNAGEDIQFVADRVKGKLTVMQIR
jgi:Cu/Ag efflux protein CusF